MIDNFNWYYLVGPIIELLLNMYIYPDLSDSEISDHFCVRVEVGGHVVQLQQLVGHVLALLSAHKLRSPILVASLRKNKYGW